MRKSIFPAGLLFAVCLTATAQYQNVMIGSQYFPEEPSIMVNPYNPDHLVAGANTNLFWYSNDGGSSWTQGGLSSPYGVYGDPCIIADTNGDFYYFHLADPPGGNWIDRIVCQKSTDGGATWSPGTYMGLDGTKAQDKEWAVVNPWNNHIYVTWTQFDQYGSSSPADSTIIRFSKSTDGGQTWSAGVRINKVAGDCIDSDNTVEGAVPAVGPNQEIYVAWAGPAGLVFTRSLDGGETWPQDNVFISEFPGGWDYAIPGIFRANGLPVTCCDLSGGSYHGRIYVNWSDQRNGTADTDVWLSKSDDGGQTWSNVIRVNDDPPGRHQFFTWMTVDQTTGFLYFVFYDRRNYSNNMTDVYLAVSQDGGETFDNIRISESPFTPVPTVFFGDYTNISVHGGIIRPIWTRLEGGNLSVWTALIDSILTGIPAEKEALGPISLEQNYPNPASGLTWFSYRIRSASTISLRICDLSGREVATVVNNQLRLPGKYVEEFRIRPDLISPGFYYFSLISGDQAVRRKMIVE